MIISINILSFQFTLFDKDYYSFILHSFLTLSSLFPQSLVETTFTKMSIFDIINGISHGVISTLFGGVIPSLGQNITNG